MIITGLGPLAYTGRIHASPGTPYGKTMSDGSVLYNYRESSTFTDITFNGTSMKPYGIIETRIWPDGHGYVMTTTDPVTSLSMSFPDGSCATYVNYGTIAVS